MMFAVEIGKMSTTFLSDLCVAGESKTYIYRRLKNA